MFRPFTLEKRAGKGTTIRTSRRVFLDEERDIIDRWEAVCYLGGRLANTIVTSNDNVLVNERGDQAQYMYDHIWVSSSFEKRIRGY